jgi:putative nucleotidyltransferase with HDIG domain
LYPLARISVLNLMLHDTTVLLDQAVPFERAGDWDSAIALCREAFRHSVLRGDLGTLTEAVLRTAFCYRHMGDRDAAMDYFELSLEIAARNQDTRRLARTYNGLGTLYHMHGEFGTAEMLYQQARAAAQAEEDLRTLGNIDQNLGSLAVIQGSPNSAIKHYEAALASYRAINFDRGVAGVLNNMGPLYIGLSDFDSAHDCLQKALAIAKQIGDAVTEGIIHINRTELLLMTGDLSQARISCDEAFEICSRIGEHANRADVLRFYGIIYRETNKPYLAETHLREAVEVASTHKYPVEEAEAQRELSLTLGAQGRNREALNALNRAHELFSGLNAKHKQADIDRRISQLQETFLIVVSRWGESIEAKDRYTRGHCQRVADYACKIAAHAGVTEREMIWFRMGAFLHDLGKMEVPSEILNKPGRLTDAEREIIESHTVAGDEMLSSIEFPWDIRPMVRSHHERWDGTGYPDGLQAEDIPTSARILRIADVFDALTTTRSYRQPLTHEEAFELMENDEGSFDPQLFAIFRELFPTLKAINPHIPISDAALE